MEETNYRTVGRSGLLVSTVGLGCNNFGMKLDRDRSIEVARAALDAGITFFDTSDSYGAGASEEFLGSAVASQRDDVVIATKFSSRMRPGPYGAGASRKYLVQACEASLRRLGTDYIDLYYQHWVDPATPIEETLDGLTDLVRSGKVRYVACSNVAAWQLVRALHLARERGLQRFAACQIEWSLLNRAVEADLVPACAAYDVGVVPYFPLAAGLLTGKYTKGKDFPSGSRLAELPFFKSMATEAAFDAVTRIEEAATAAGVTVLEAALAWLVHQPTVCSVLVGATSPQQVAANVAAAGKPLTAEVIEALGAAAGGPAA